MTAKIKLDAYGAPPELPSVDEIIEDIGKASLNDIVFKSANDVKAKKNLENGNSKYYAMLQLVCWLIYQVVNAEI